MSAVRKLAANRDDIKAVANAAQETAAAAAAASKDAAQAYVIATDSLVKASTEVSQKTLDQATQIAKDQVEKTSSLLFQTYDDLTGFGKDNIDAAVKSGQLLARGYEELSRAVFRLVQENLETAIATSKALLSCTTLTQIVDLQSAAAKAQLDKTLAESTKLGELSLKVAQDAAEPIQGRVNAAVEKFLKPVR